MYVAELHGKLPSSLRLSEDILTSNVFSFLKYADRGTFLKRFLALLGLELAEHDLESVEFAFWPKFEDGTEPDVVLISEDHYILIEAKYTSGFDPGGELRDHQLDRELMWGSREAESLGKEFFPVAITSQSARPEELRASRGDSAGIAWVNWQCVARLLVLLFEEEGEQLSDFEFATDLYQLLVAKGLRNFIGFDRLEGITAAPSSGDLFFDAGTSKFRGDFLGFKRSLPDIKLETPVDSRLFYTREYYRHLASIPPIGLKPDAIFWRE